MCKRMKKFKKTLAFVLAFIMSVSVLYGTDLNIVANAETTKVVYFDNAKTKWSTVCAYIWGGSQGSQTLKGTKVEGNIYKMNIPEEYSNILFKNTESGWDKQTADTTIPTNDNNCFKPSSSSNKSNGTWYHYEESTIVTTATPTVKPTKTPKLTATPKATKTPKPTATPKVTKTPKPTATPKVTKTPKPISTPTLVPSTNNVTVYYTTSYSTTYIHYINANGNWTNQPGEKMNVIGNLASHTINLGNFDQTKVCFNNGAGKWDSKNGYNYVVKKGYDNYIENGTVRYVKKGETFSPNPTPSDAPITHYNTIYYCDVNTTQWLNAYAHAWSGDSDSDGITYDSIETITLKDNGPGWTYHLYKFSVPAKFTNIYFKDLGGPADWRQKTKYLAMPTDENTVYIEGNGIAGRYYSEWTTLSDLLHRYEPVYTTPPVVNTTVKFDNTIAKWNRVFAYVWNNDNDAKLFSPENVSNNIYTFTITGSYKNIIFKNVGYLNVWDLQTNDLLMPTDKNNIYRPLYTGSKVPGSWYGANVSTPSPTPKVTPTPVPVVNNVTVYYTTNYSTTYIHYIDANGSWTNLPGKQMNVTGNLASYTINLGDFDQSKVCFNNGAGTWDSNNGYNYVVKKGYDAYIENGTVRYVKQGVTPEPQKQTLYLCFGHFNKWDNAYAYVWNDATDLKVFEPVSVIREDIAPSSGMYYLIYKYEIIGSFKNITFKNAPESAAADHKTYDLVIPTNGKNAYHYGVSMTGHPQEYWISIDEILKTPTASPTPTPEIKIPVVPQPEGNPVESGTYTTNNANIQWKIYPNGLLEVKGKGDIDWFEADWNQHSHLITSARFELTEVTNLDSLCSKLKNMESIDVSKVDTSKVTNMECTFCGCNSLTVIDISNWDTSKVTNMTQMFSFCENLENILAGSYLGISGHTIINTFDNLDTSNVTNMSGMFNDCKSLGGLDLNGLNTSKVTNMGFMFSGCTNLSELYFNCDTSKVTEMQYMFADCTNLTNLQIGNLNTSKVKYVSGMFSGWDSYKCLDLSKFNTSNITDMSEMFAGAKSYKDLDLSKLNTSNVTDMSRMFADAKSYKDLDLSKLNTSKVTNMSEMFAGAKSYKDLDLSKLNTSKVTNMSRMFANSESTTVPDFRALNFSKVTTMSDMFEKCYNLKSVDFSNINTPNLTDMAGMFAYCEALETVNMNNMNLSNVTYMENTFCWCPKLKNINLTNVNTSNLKNISSLFMGCIALPSIDVSSLNTSKVTDMSSLFYDCIGLQEIDLSNFDTSNVTDMNAMFAECSHLNTLTFSEKFTTQKVTDMNDMFYRCKGLQEIDLHTFITPNLERVERMFKECTNLQEIDFSGFDPTNVYSTEQMFAECYNLKTVNFCDTFLDWPVIRNMTEMFYNCRNLEYIYFCHTSSNIIIILDESPKLDRAFEGCKNLKFNAFVKK